MTDVLAIKEPIVNSCDVVEGVGRIISLLVGIEWVHLGILVLLMFTNISFSLYLSFF